MITLNNSIYFGNNISSFNNNEPIFDIESMYAYDTHTAQITTFDSKETLKLKEILKNFDQDLNNVILNKKKISFVNDLIENEILLENNRIITFGKMKNASVWLQSNHACNLACPGCSTGMDIKQTVTKNMSEDVLRSCINKIAENAIKKGFQKVNIKLGGGEPTIRGRKWIEEVSKIINEVKFLHPYIDIDITLLSNGILVNDSMYDVLYQNNIECVISTDPSRVFPKVNIPTIGLVLNNIQKLKAKGIKVTAQLTIGSHNAEDVIKIHKKLTDMEVSITWSLFRPNSKEQYVERCNTDTILAALKKIYSYTYDKITNNEFYGNIIDFDYLGVDVVKDGVCGAGKNYIVLDYNGDVYSCTEKMEINNGEKINILESKDNVFDIISKVHEVPMELRYTKNIQSDYKFKWQSGLGCPWVIKKENDSYNNQSNYMTKIYEELMPILIGLNIYYKKL